MNHLTRELAPIAAEAWKQIDEEARERLTPHLAARRVVDVSGPHGWDYSATNLGRVRPVDHAGTARVGQRQVLPLTEVRVPFTVGRDELDSAERGATDLAFDDLDRAAHDIAVLENKAVFHGWDEAGFTGLATTTTATALGADAANYPHAVAKAVDILREAGIKGPYALAIGPLGHRRIMESTEHGGLLVLDHLRRILGGGKVLRAPGVDGAVVASLDGGHFVLELGQDVAVGYSHHDADAVTLYLEESFSFRVLEPDAATALTE